MGGSKLDRSKLWVMCQIDHRVHYMLHDSPNLVLYQVELGTDIGEVDQNLLVFQVYLAASFPSAQG